MVALDSLKILTRGINKDTTTKFYRGDIQLDKGAKVDKNRIQRNLLLYQSYMEYFMNYPDKFVDLLTPVDSKFKLKFFQRMFLRACVRYGRVLTIAPRAAGKSFICILALLLICIFRPKSTTFICSPGKAQSAKIAQQKLAQLFDMLPMLKSEIAVENYGTDYIKIIFHNKSSFVVVTPLNSSRGQRATVGIIDEFRDHDPTDIAEIILPLLNVDRPMTNGDKNPSEPQQVQLWISSASEKNTFCYDKTIELFEQSVINPSNTFFFGFDYRIPVLTGLLSKTYLNELKTSSTFDSLGFAKEYMSRFVGTSEDAWFDFNKLESARKINNPETVANFSRESDKDCFYILSTDLARKGCQSVCTVLKVYPTNETFRIKLVNIYILGVTESEKDFTRQVIEQKRLIAQYNPRACVIDINGVGAPFGDLMIKESYDDKTGITYPPYGFMNRDEYLANQPRGCQKILYGIKANAQINSDMHAMLYSKIYSGQLRFLISEQQAKNKLISTIKGAKMSPEEQNIRLRPHILTSILLKEILNLKIRPTGVSNQIAVEQINTRILKDKFSALEMGVYYVVQLEQENMAKRRNRGLGNGAAGRNLVFASRGSSGRGRSNTHRRR